jgi:hypothetical protein
MPTNHSTIKRFFFFFQKLEVKEILQLNALDASIPNLGFHWDSLEYLATGYFLDFLC